MGDFAGASGEAHVVDRKAMGLNNKQGRMTMPKYTIRTDDFFCEDIEADSLSDAIEQCDFGSNKIADAFSLREHFERKLVPDGGWCWIERDGERVLEIGECP